MEDYTNCLRPTFTANVIKLLNEGFSLNIIGSPGTGRTRLLEDISTCCRQSMHMVVVNMKSYKNSYGGFMGDLCAQCDFIRSHPRNLGEFVKTLDASEGKTFVCFDNFDALLESYQIDRKYNEDFYNTLNSIKHNPKVSLLCVTEVHYNKPVIFINGKFETSILELRAIELPRLSLEEIRGEVSRDIINNNLSLSDEDRTFMINTIHDAKKPYALLKYSIEKITHNEDAELDFKERIRKWRERLEKTAFGPKTVKKASDRVILWAKVLRLDKVKIPFSFLGKFGTFIDRITNYFETKTSATKDAHRK
jgi:ATPase family associated with various cellular activities (AAA)